VIGYASEASISLITSLIRFSLPADFLTTCNASLTPKTCFAAVLISFVPIDNAVPSATRERKMPSESAVVS
jgi:hypothetical protein